LIFIAAFIIAITLYLWTSELKRRSPWTVRFAGYSKSRCSRIRWLSGTFIDSDVASSIFQISHQLQRFKWDTMQCFGYAREGIASNKSDWWNGIFAFNWLGMRRICLLSKALY